MRTSRFHRSNRRRIILIASGVVLLAALITTGVLEKTGHIHLFETKKPAKHTSPGDINYGPPTKQDEKQVGDNKQAIVKQQEAQQHTPPPSPQPAAKKPVKPDIVYAGNGDVRAHVTGVIEDGGTCTAVFTSGGNRVTKSSTGFADATTTTCLPISYSGSAVQPGWSVTVQYDSASSQGTSDAAQVQ